MTAPLKLTVVMTHPVQYYAPWFRYIAAHCPEIDLTVLYATQPTPEQQGVGFGQAFAWDIPLTKGYRCEVVRPARSEDNVHSNVFWGLDVPEICLALLDSQPDVVLIMGWYSITLMRALWACRWRRIPVLYRGDTHLGSAPGGWRRPAWIVKTWLLLRLFNGYLSVGRRAKEYLQWFGVRESRIFSAPHCVDNDFFAASAAPYQIPSGRAAARASFGLNPDDFVVLFVSKLEPTKRPLDLIFAVTSLKRGARLLVVGTGELEQQCRKTAKDLGVDVAWAGFLNQSELGRAYAMADCLVLPSCGETWGLVVNEALATGLPCVVSDRVGCAPDLITPGETGEIFPMGAVAAMATALERVRAQWKAGHNFASACKARAATYSFQAATAGLLAACHAVTIRHRRRSIVRNNQAAPRVIACCGSMVIVSGLERMTFEVLRVLCKRGSAVHCIVNTWENHRIVGLAEQIGASWSTGYYWYRFDRHTQNPIKLGQLAWDILLTSLSLLKDVWRFRPTHILISDFVSVLRNWPALALLRLMGLSVFLAVQNAPATGSFYYRIWRLGVNPVVDRILCASIYVQQGLSAHGISKGKTSVIYNTAPTRADSGPNCTTRNGTTVIYIGQIIPEKGLDLLLDALGLLVARGYDIQLDVVGQMDGWVPPAYVGYRECLISRSIEPDLSGRVHFLGFREDVPALLAGASIHCCPSRPEMLEGLPLVAIEAKLASIPTVAFSVGPFPELIVHREDGWLCTEVSAEALAEGIEYFLANPARLDQARQAARSSAEKFCHERFADAWWKVFNQQ